MSEAKEPKATFQAANTLHPRTPNLTNKRFGKLLVVSFYSYDYSPTRQAAQWICKCDCGKEFITLAMSLRNGDAKSCGCTPKSHSTHGMTHTRIYKIYGGMIQRCTNPKAPHYDSYGGAGVRICDRWLNSFDAFLEDTKDGYSDKLTIDRFPDKNGNYEPGNTRWATRKQQVDNREISVKLTINGITASIADWSKISGTKHATINTRYFRGWAMRNAYMGKGVKDGIK